MPCEVAMLRGQRIVSWTTQHGVEYKRGAPRRFAGEPEHVVNYFFRVAEEVRELRVVHAELELHLEGLGERVVERVRVRHRHVAVARDAAAPAQRGLRGGAALPGVEALDFSAIVEDKRGQHLRGTREWVFEAVDKWRRDAAAPQLFWLAGGGGTGKSVASWVEIIRRFLDERREAAHF